MLQAAVQMRVHPAILIFDRADRRHGVSSFTSTPIIARTCPRVRLVPLHRRQHRRGEGQRQRRVSGTGKCVRRDANARCQRRQQQRRTSNNETVRSVLTIIIPFNSRRG